MNIEMVDVRRQYLAIKREIDEAVSEVIESGAYIRGPQVGEFECELAGRLGGSYALGVGNGTDALQIAFMALGVGPGDEVITTSFTFVATAEAAMLLGARPVFADVDPRTFNIDAGKIEELITDRTKAVVPVHLFGQPADMNPILEIARRHGLRVVEDNAQAIGSQYGERKTGYIGDVGCLSFFPSKNLGCFGDGGAVLTDDEALYRRMRMIANHGSEKKYYNEVVGVNSRLDTIQAAVLRVKLRRLDEYNAARHRAAGLYDALFAECELVTTPHHAPGRTHVYHQYTIRISDDVPGGRDGLVEHLKKDGVPCAVYYPVPLHQLPVYSDCPRGDLRETEHAAREVVSLPMHTELTEEQQEHIARTVLEYVERASA